MDVLHHSPLPSGSARRLRAALDPGIDLLLPPNDDPATVLAMAPRCEGVIGGRLPADWLAAASSGAKAKAGTWEDTSADADGTAAHFRIYASDGTTAHIQGTVGQGSGDLQLDNVVLATGQTVTITSFTITDGNA